MPREMLEDLVNLVKPHKDEYPELYNYLMLTWTACKYNSTLYACNVTGMIMCQRHLSFFEPEYIEFFQKEQDRGNI